MSGDITERMLHLRQIPVAAMLPPPVLRILAGALRPRTFHAGRTLMKQGGGVDALFLLTDGALRLERGGALFGELSAPQTLGFLSILAREDAPYDAVATSEVRCYELETDTLLDLFADHFELVEATIQYLAERLWFEFQELPQEMLGMPPVDLGEVPDGPVDLVQMILYLRKTSGFAKANVNALAVMAQQRDEIRYPAGANIWKAGEPSEHVVTIFKGAIRCVTPDGRAFTYGPGTGVGGIEALAKRPRWYDATAIEPIIGLRGHSENLLELFEHQHRMAMDFMAMLARAQTRLLERKVNLGKSALAVTRQVKKLGTVRYGA